jgi:4-diphosphocytidyl-2-C-methyl-D-erythritol kinase
MSSTTPSTAPGRIVVRAPAKINLTLDVLGRRPDGYHALRSVMQTLDLHDTLEVRPAPVIRFACDAPALAGENNLVLRAARLLRTATGYGGGVDVTLHKRIPVDAGLGGGSSDAAATLLALNQLWGLALAPERLAEFGAALGSDVPFFLYAPLALVLGRGEVVEALPPAPPASVVLHQPPCGLSTARVFAALPPTRYGDGSGTERLLAALQAGLAPGQWPLSNGLQETVTALYPEVAAALRRLREAGAPQAVLTGSGSTVYALFTREDDARRVYSQLTAAGHHAILTASVPAPATETGDEARGGPSPPSTGSSFNCDNTRWRSLAD